MRKESGDFSFELPNRMAGKSRKNQRNEAKAKRLAKHPRKTS